MPIGSGPAEIASVKSSLSLLSPLIDFNYVYSMGPMLIGTVFNVLLYGIMITQVYLYFQSYSKSVFCFLNPACTHQSNPRAEIEFG